MVDAAQPLILWLVAELGPEAQVGGLGEVARTLPALLRKRGLDVRLCVPCHRAFKPALKQATGTLDAVGRRFNVLEGDRRGVPTYYLQCDELFDREGVYGAIDDDAFRFGVFARAAVELGRRLGADVVHAHDWQTALAMVFSHQLGLKARTVLTVHNVAYQGVVGSDVVPALGLPWSVAGDDGLGFGWQVVNLLKGGALAADWLTTVSVTHAHDITTVEGGFGLHHVFAQRASHLRGIMNGIDTQSWNPETDPALVSHAPREGWKQNNRRALAETLQWPLSDRPLVCSIGRLVQQKGIDVLVDTAQAGLPFDLLVIGVGDPGLRNALQGLQRGHAHRVRFVEAYDDALSRRALAASDFFVMPSRFEPAGLAQLQALRYGAIPIVRRTGGLAESVVDMGEADGNGICFADASVASLSHAFDRALALYRDEPAFTALQRAALNTNVSWDLRVSVYEKFYREVTAHDDR